MRLDILSPSRRGAATERFGQISRLHGPVENAINRAQAAMLGSIRQDVTGAYVRSEVDGEPGYWETGDAVRALKWVPENVDVLRSLTKWLKANANEDGGFPPWPDISTRASYCEPTSRILLSLCAVQRSRLFPNVFLRSSIERACAWLVHQQNDDGGWGSRRGFGTRTTATCYAVLALHEAAAWLDGDVAAQAADALKRSNRWFATARNSDGGWGLARHQESNACSMAQALWALDALGAVPANAEQALRQFIGEVSELSDVRDKISDPIAALFGRFELHLIARPLCLIGLLACRVPLGDPMVGELISSMVRSQGKDGLWPIPDRRSFWPTHFHIWALRTWLNTHDTYASNGLFDIAQFRALSPLGEGAHESVAPNARRSAFLSHNAADDPVVAQISAMLRAAQIDVWTDDPNLSAGDTWIQKITSNIDASNAFIILVTEYSERSDWVRYELQQAIIKNVESQGRYRLIPIFYKVEQSVLAADLRPYTWRRADTVFDAARLILEAIHDT